MSKIAIMQPYFFPYLGYFSLIKNTDRFILLDNVQFIRHGWIERNRILKQDEGWLYVKVPLVKHQRDTLIKDVQIDTSQDWQSKIMAQLQTYKKIAPNYTIVNDLVSGVINKNFDNIVDLNQATTEVVCEYLGIKRDIEVFSKTGIKIDEPKSPDEWALNICKSIEGASEYWNSPGGQEFFDTSKYSEAGIKIYFQKVALEEYNQKREFESGLSILDVMMFNSPEEINKMLDNYELV